MGNRESESAEGAMWREFGLRRALANMPSHSPGRPVIEALLARGTLTAEEARRFKKQGLRTALASMPADSPGRLVVQRLLAAQSSGANGDVHEAEESASAGSSMPASRPDLATQLERLVSLHDRGHLTDREFEAAKQRLLA
jgi:Short C-terminal domain